MNRLYVAGNPPPEVLEQMSPEDREVTRADRRKLVQSPEYGRGELPNGRNEAPVKGSKPMTARELTNVLCLGGWGWSPLTHLMIPNCNSLSGWEQDLVVLHDSRWLEEVEVKVSASDFRREFNDKANKHIKLADGSSLGNLVRRYWFAMPEELAAQLGAEIPEYAGLLAVTRNPLRQRVTIVKRAPALRHARKLTDEETIKLLRLAHIRYWEGRRREKWSE